MRLAVFQKNLKNFSVTSQAKVNRLECKICSKGFKSSLALKNHRNTHTNGKPYECECCGKNFKRKFTLKKHKRNHLEGEELFKCNICNKMFLHYNTMKGHILGHITDDKAVETNNFTRNGDLKDNRKSQTRVKDFECKMCKESYSKKIYLDAHMLLHEGRKPHVWDFCPKSYKIMDYLKEHVKRQHPNKRFKSSNCCETCGEIFSCKSEIDNHRSFVCDLQVRVKDKQTQTLWAWNYRNHIAHVNDDDDD